MSKSTRLVGSLIMFFPVIAFGSISAPLEKNHMNACHIGFGYDYALFTMEAGYARGVELSRFNRQLHLNADLTIPMLKPDLFDWRTRIGATVTTLKIRRFRVPVHLDAIIRSGKNSSCTARGFGTGLSFLPGICFRKFSVNAELTWDQQWATHVEHSDLYRQWVFADAKDGWYGTAAFIIRYGARAGISVKEHFEVLLSGGCEQDGRYDYRTPPFYGTLSVNRRF